MSRNRLALLGLWLAAFGTAHAQAPGNLIQNGSFETGDFSAWAQSGNTAFSYVFNQPFNGPRRAGWQRFRGAWPCRQ